MSRGLALESTLDSARIVELAPATHAGYSLAADGVIQSSKVASLPRASSAPADALSLIDG
jgi:hypothetical protein